MTDSRHSVSGGAPSSFALAAGTGAAVAALARPQRRGVITALVCAIVAAAVACGLLLAAILHIAVPAKTEADIIEGVWSSRSFRAGGQSDVVSVATATVVFYHDGRAEVYRGHELIHTGIWVVGQYSGKPSHYYEIYGTDASISRFYVDELTELEVGHFRDLDRTVPYDGNGVTPMVDEWTMFKIDLEPELYWKYV
ncbi:MAG: hypothetical protein IKD70_05520 [Eggerthellaceae bacterium]|nr:hypothetical protein [Eggerthellaceae bacterium]